MAIVNEAAVPSPLKVSPSINPNVIVGVLEESGVQNLKGRRRFKYTEGEDPVLDAALHSMRGAMHGANLIAETDFAIRSDRTLNPTLAQIQRQKNANGRGTALASSLSSAIERLEASVSAYEKNCSAPKAPKELIDIQFEGEIRAAFKNMKPAERKDQIDEAFNTLNERVIGALLRGEPFLMGMKTEEYGSLKHRYQTLFHGPETERNGRHRSTLQSLQHASNALDNLIAEASGGKETNAAVAAMQKREELMGRAL